MSYNWVTFFLIHSGNLYLLIGAFRPLMFREFIVVVGLISTTYITVFYILPCSLFWVLSSPEARTPIACVPQQEKSLQWEAHVLQLESNPCSPQLEKACTAMRSQHSQKQINIFKEIYSLSNFQICNTVLLTTVTMLHITSPRLIYFITGSL